MPSQHQPADLNAIADEHSVLLQAISELESAPADLRDTSSLLESLEADITVREDRLKALIKNRVAEHKDLEGLQRSSTKRLFVRLKHGGKEGLAKRLEKEEREYIEAAQAEHNENIAIADLKDAAENAKKKKETLERQVVDRREKIRRIDSLYTSAFSGPTPDYPEDDAAEDELHEAEEHHSKEQSLLNHHKHIFSLLDKAAGNANEAQSALQNANRSATYDSIGIGGLWVEMAERDHLVRAQSLASQAHQLLWRARGEEPLVKHIPVPKVVQPEWLNVVFDNIFTDLMFQQKIQESIQHMTRFQNAIFEECRNTENRVKESEQRVREAAEFLRSKRRQLMSVRREILTRLAEDNQNAPPVYQSGSGMQIITEPFANASITMPNGPSEPPPPTYDTESASSGPRYAPPPGPPPNVNISVNSPERPSRTPRTQDSFIMHQPPAGPPPSLSRSISSSAATTGISRTLSAGSSSSHHRSRSLSPHVRPESSLDYSLYPPRPQDVPLPPTPSFPQSPYESAHSSPFTAHPRTPSPISPNSPFRFGSSGMPPGPGGVTNDEETNMMIQFPQPFLPQHTSPRHTSTALPSSPNLRSPWLMHALSPDEDVTRSGPSFPGSSEASSTNGSPATSGSTLVQKQLPPDPFSDVSQSSRRTDDVTPTSLSTISNDERPLPDVPAQQLSADPRSSGSAEEPFESSGQRRVFATHNPFRQQYAS